MLVNSFGIFLTLVAAARLIAAQNSVTVHVPSAVPTDAAGPIDPAFVGLAFEQTDFYWYAFNSETGGPNTFSQNLVNSISKRTQSTPILRVGGTTGDKGSFNASLDLPVPRKSFGNTTVPNLRCKSAEECLQLGPSYFDAFKQFEGVKYMFMVPQMPPRLSNALKWTKAGLDAIGDKLEVVEIGNEPD
ncbi:glycoside hydrolase family 79 protein, partial [Polychaeton citri CBS 116435]